MGCWKNTTLEVRWPCIGEGYDKGNPGDFDWENKWTADVYNKAIINAKEWQEEVNKVIIKHTAESDGITREWSNWNARLTGDIWGDSISEDEWESYEKTMGEYGYVSGYVEGCGHDCDIIWDKEPVPGHFGEDEDGNPGWIPYEPEYDMNIRINVVLFIQLLELL